MLGAIAGDVIGSVYEARPIKTTDFPLFVERSTFTDDTVLTVAVAYAILHDVDYAASTATRWPVLPEGLRGRIMGKCQKRSPRPSGKGCRTSSWRR